MGVATELGYRLEEQGGASGLIRRLTSTRPVTALLSKTLRPMDTFALKVTRGRGTVSKWLAGLPPLWLTVRGARTGQPRTTPLFGVPIGDDLGILATSYGQSTTPAWAHNLTANPEAKVSFGDRTIEIRARFANQDEKEQIWATAARIYPGYAVYRSRAGDRDIRVFVLEAAG